MAVQIFVCLNTNVLHLLPNSAKVPSHRDETYIALSLSIPCALGLHEYIPRD